MYQIDHAQRQAAMIKGIDMNGVTVPERLAQINTTLMNHMSTLHVVSGAQRITKMQQIQKLRCDEKELMKLQVKWR